MVQKHHPMTTKRLVATHSLSLLVLVVLVFHGLVYQNVAPITPSIDHSPISESETPQVLAAQLLISQFQTGATLTQYSLDNWGNTAAVNAAKALFNGSTKLGAQHVMGFGVLNPQPSPNAYDWRTLDERMNQSLSGVDSTVLVACCAPDWMKGGFAGQTNWSRIEDAPRPEHYDNYANLIARTVQRYPRIKYVLVWNEMKGMWNGPANRWNHEGYTQLYNRVWARVKAVRPSVKIGGPYVVLQSRGGSNYFNSSVGGSWGYFDSRDLEAVKYWLRHKTGADFIAVDASNTNVDNVYKVNRFAMTEKFTAARDWIRSLSNSTYPGATTLPLWWAEWYAFTENSSDSQAKKNAVMATGLVKTIKSGATTALIWGPQGNASGASYPLGLFTDTRTSGGGKATVFHKTQKWLNDHFSKGTRIVKDGNTNKNIEVLASDRKILLVNKTAATQTTKVLGKSVSLAGYQVALENVPTQSTGSTSGTAKPKATTPKATAPVSNPIRPPHAPAPKPASESANRPAEEVVPVSEESPDPEEAPAEEQGHDYSTLSALASALNSNQPVRIGSRQISPRPIKYVLLVMTSISAGLLIYLHRERLAAIPKNIFGKPKS